MLKRNLLKRVLPIMLSVAMAFQSVPMTALAVEDPGAVVSTTEADPATEPEASETSSPDGDDSLGLTEDTSAASDSGQTSDGTTTDTDDSESETTDAGSGTETGSTETETGNAETETGNTETEVSKTETTDTETGTETSDGENKDDAEQPGEDVQATVTSTEITIDENVLKNNLPYGFSHDDIASRPTYTVSYSDSENDQFNTVMGTIKNVADLKVNDKSAPALKDDYLILEWKEVKKAGDGTETLAAMTGTPRNVGSYALHLETRPVDGLCGEAKCDVYFNITPKKLFLDDYAIQEVISSLKAGSKVADFKEAVAKKCKFDGYDEFPYSTYSVAVKVYKVGEEAETTDALFNKNGDSYKVKVEVTLDDAVAAANYELEGGEYSINFAGLTATKVEVKNPGKELTAVYDEKTTYTASAFAADVKNNLAATVMVEGKDAAGETTYESLGADVKAIPGWFAKEIENSEINDFPTTADDNKQFMWNGALYTLITDGDKAQEEVAVGEVGDYYLVFTYEGVEGQYAPSHSEPIKFTINPIEVILKPALNAAWNGKAPLSTGMSDDGLSKMLAEMSAEFYTPDAADTSKAGAKDETATGKLKEKDFFGVSYENTNVTQYYTPVFELICKARTANTAPEGGWPADATDEQKWNESTTKVTSASQLKESEEGKSEYKYYVRFTGKKAVYGADGSKYYEKPIAEATDAANRNYKVKADADTLGNVDNMLEIQLTPAAKTEIDVTEIIKAFNGEAGRGKGGAGLSSDAAWTVYDPNARLFADKETYKLAKVTDAASTIENTHKDLTYTWESAEYDYYYEYYNILNMEKNEGEKDEDFAKRKTDAIKDLEENGFTSEGTYTVPQDAGLYRLHVHYEDSSVQPQNAPADAYVYFLIKKQELVLAADTQFAEYDQSVGSFLPKGDAYSVYLLPDNNVEAQPELLDWKVNNPQWHPMNLKKNADGSDSTEWEESEGKFKNTTPAYKYGAAVWFDDAFGNIEDREGQPVKNDAGVTLNWWNYTTNNMDTYKDGDCIVRFLLGDIQFGASEIEVVVDKTKMPANKVYDGVRSAGLPEGLVKLTDKNGAEIPATTLQVNGEPQEGVGTVEVAWRWINPENGAQISSEVVWPDEVVYGGTYRLVARFGGYSNADGTTVYAPYKDSNWVPLTDADGNCYEWTINPLKIEISPAVKEEVTAGDVLSEMVEDGHVVAAAVNTGEKIPDGTNVNGEADENINDDTWLFNKVDNGKVWNAVTRKETTISGYPIVGGRWIPNYYKDSKPADGNLIRYGSVYAVKFADKNLWAQYQYSYDVTMKTAGPTTINRGDADVEGSVFFQNDYGYSGYVDVYLQKEAEYTYQIIPREGIPFVYDGYVIDKDLITGEEIPLDKNYIAVNIVSPREFSDELFADVEYAQKNFVYKNSIHAAGGYVINEFRTTRDENGSSVYRYCITALFPVELEENGSIKAIEPFSVTWEKDYTDTFKFNLTNAKLEANLKVAVAPKTIAFNGVQSKMAVGEEQQLDVKMTKKQLGDVIRINYRLKGGVTSNKYASIDPETGLLTALATENKKPVKVDIEAYPVRLAADGKTYEEITGKGVKIAKTKVTITEVTAPAIKKVLPQDSWVEVQFTKVNDGYRGEIYVKQFADKKAAGKFKAADFENEIANMKNGQWQGTFAVKPMYFSGTRGYDEKLKLCRKYVTNLEKGFYAIYVRNVSAVRTLADGTKTTESAAGSVKAFETTKSQVQRLDPYFVVEDGEKTKANPVRYNGDEKSQEQQRNNRKNHMPAHYTVELTDKSAQLAVDGRFSQKPSKEAADNETMWLPLPLKAAEQQGEVSKGYYTNTYLEPKLTYFVMDGGVEDGEAPKYDINHKLLNPSKLVKISNKGKLTFKNVDLNGDLTVRVYAQADNGTTGFCILTITARPDTITTKKTKPMKVGDAIRLRDYIEYKQGKAKVPNYWSTAIEITNKAEVEEAGFEIWRAGFDGATHPSIDGGLREGEYVIIAKKENASCNLKFTDLIWSDAQNRKKSDECTVALRTTKLDPVKGLKTVYTDDTSITVNFSHPGHPEAFDIEVKDARGSVVYKRLASREWMETVSADFTKDSIGWLSGYVEYYGLPLASDELIPAGLQNVITNLQRSNLLRTVGRNFVYFEKTKTYAYTIRTDKLMRLSAYTVSVTPVYDGVRAAKPANTKAKTTNIPASYENVDVINPEYNSGMDLDNLETYLVSGNTYTVTADVDDLARRRGTDTLTWKSSNSKVASVKANQGSFSATVKALSQGKTTITVTSKVTKKTIARYHIAVKAVGKGIHYGGEYETGGNNGFFDKFIKTVDPYYEGRLEVLTVSNPVVITEEDYLNKDDPSYYGDNERTWVKFTAPSYGEYTFTCGYSVYDWENERYDWVPQGYRIFYSNGTSGRGTVINTPSKMLKLEAGQEIYFRVDAGFFTLSVIKYTDFTKLTTSYNTEKKALNVGDKDMWISFTAPEENVYTFNSRSSLSFEQNDKPVDTDDNYDNGVYSYSKSLKAGETIFIKVYRNNSLWVTKREFAPTTLTAGGSVNLSITKDNKDVKQYVRFTADATGEYTFTYSPRDKVDAKFYTLSGSNELDKVNGDTVVSEEIGKAKVFADGDAPTPVVEYSVRLYIQAGETIVIEITASDPEAVIDDASKIDVTVKAAAPVGEKVLTVGENTVTKATTQMFSFVIPNDTAATKYKLTTTGTTEIKWYYGRTEKDLNMWGSSKKLARLYDITDSFTVENGSVIYPELTGKRSLYAGDTIYLEVTAAADAENAKVTLAKETTAQKTFNETTPATVVLGTSGTAEWYTFTAKKAGYYEFSKEVTVAPTTSTAQDVTVGTVGKAFETNQDYKVNLSGTSVVAKLNAGEYVFMIKADRDAIAEGDKTTVKLSVREIVPTVLKSGENTITVTKGKTEYYTFKKTSDDNCEIKWTSGTDVGTPSVQYTDGDLAYGSYNTFTDTFDVEMKNTTYTIKVTADSDKDLTGKLEVIAEEKNFLASGKETTITFTKDGSKTYTFTTPEDNDLGYVVTVENASVVPEGGKQPTVTVQEKINEYYNKPVVNNLGKEKVSKEMTDWNWKQKYQKHTFTISAVDVTPAAEGVTAINAVVKITVKPIIPEAFPGAAFKVKKGDEPRWYTYTVPADDRYVLDYTVGADQAKDSVQVTWSRLDGTTVSTERYLKKDQKLYVKVEARDTIADAGVDVTLKTPVKLPATMLSVAGENTVSADDVKDGAVKYFIFKAPAYAKYEIDLDGNKSGLMCKQYVAAESGYDWWPNPGFLEKDEEILIKVTNAGKLTITQNTITEFTVGTPSAEIKLKKDESVAFALKVYKDGYYDFKVSDAKGLIIDGADTIYQDRENKCYFVSEISQNETGDRYQFTITNPTEDEVTIKVTASELTPVSLAEGKNNVPVTKDKAAVVKFRAREDYWYTFACSAGSEIHGDIQNGEKFYATYDEEEGYEYTGVVVYTGAEAVTADEVTVSKLAPPSANGEEIPLTLEKDESQWYAYRTGKAGLYKFTAPDGATLKLYWSLKTAYEITPNEMNYYGGGRVGVGANKDLYIKVTNSSEGKLEPATARIKVECDPATELTVLGEAGNPITGTGTKYLTFKAPEDGMYTFVSEKGYLNHCADAWLSPEGINGQEYPMMKDEVAYLRVENGSEENNVITVMKAKDVKFLAHVDVKDGKYQWITFTAPKDGNTEYTFFSTNYNDDPYVWVFEDRSVGDNADSDTLHNKAIRKDDDSGENWNFSVTILLYKGEKVEIAAGNNGLGAGSYDVYVSY